MKANLTGIPETLFIMLRIRAIETVRQDAAIKDPYSVDMLKQIEFEASEKTRCPKRHRQELLSAQWFLTKSFRIIQVKWK